MTNKINGSQVYFLDTTLRDGEQAPGLVFSYAEKRKLAELLCDSGVDEIEAGTPAMGKREQEFISSLRDLRTPVSCWCRATEKDIYAASKCNSERIHISFPVSKTLLLAMQKRKKWLLDSLEILYKEAKKDFSYISVGAMDASRCDRFFLLKFVKAAESIGYNRIRISDTVGIASPLEIKSLFELFKDISTDLDFHGHNDLGMATANALTALQSGASWVNTTLLGIGERAGNAALEELVAATIINGKNFSNINLKNIQKAAKHLSEIMDEKISPRKPVVGKNIFTHESGIHYALQLRNNISFQPCEPQLLGRKNSHFILGKHSGNSSIKDFCETHGLTISKEESSHLVFLVRDFAEKEKRALNTKEALTLINDFIKERSCEELETL